MAKRWKDKAKQPKTGGPKTMGPKLQSVRIENPDWRPDLDGEKAFPRTVVAAINVRESAIETLYARKFLGRAQKQAADRFREIWESAGGRIISVDYSRERVDGARGDPVAAKLRAMHELRRCRELIGRRGFENIEAVCGEGKALTELTPHKRERLTMADNLRADLDDLATMWGFQTRQRSVA
jgi:hypothetical protein